MLAKYYLNNEDGTFTKFDFEDDVDVYTRLYKGDMVESNPIYDIEIKDDVMTCYACKPGSDLLDGIEYLQIEIFDEFYGETDYHVSPEQYLEGKKCQRNNGVNFIMGKILKRYNVKDEPELFPELDAGGSFECMI